MPSFAIALRIFAIALSVTWTPLAVACVVEFSVAVVSVYLSGQSRSKVCAGTARLEAAPFQNPGWHK
jgi:hypothetical protein